ncbi:MAG: hypothetical protein EP347_09625 [Alphaproteobacteria bacterium]|nr:MAG: hypothetical protein EP347_09625 [Alphaproteobacteria bacterium]
MTVAQIIWLGLAIFYGVFFVWYTNFSGPLRSHETEAFLKSFEARGAPAARLEMLRKFMEEDDGRQFIMMNLLDLAEGEVTVRGDRLTGQASMDRYMAHMMPALLKRACHPVLFGPIRAPAMDRVGIEGADNWKAAGLVRYRSRRDMLAIASDPAFQEPHDFKLAALERTLAFPFTPGPNLGDPRLVLALLFLAIAGVIPRVPT